MKTMKHLAVAGLLGGSVLVSTPAMAELTGNAGVMSQYLFRGLEQGSGAAGYGGIDYAHESGFYAGTWAATIGFGSNSGSSSEVDFYTGYAGDAGAVSYDVGVLYYWYSEEDEGANADPSNNTLEFYGSLGFGIFSLSAYYVPDTYFASVERDGSDAEGAYGVYGSISQPLNDILSLDAAIGYNAGDGNEFWANGEDSYMEYSLGVSAALDNGFGMSFGLVMTDIDGSPGNGYNAADTADDDPKLVVDASYSFDLQ